MGIDAQMFVKTRQGYSEDDVRLMAYRLGSCFDHGWPGLSIVRPGEFDWHPDGRHCLELVNEYKQDGPTLTPEKGERFIEVHLLTRYYDEGYERGHWPLIYAIARWLETNIHDAEVWYGGDSSGVLAKPLDGKRKVDLWGLFCTSGHEPYRAYFDTDYGEPVERPMCYFCGVVMKRTGWGPDGWAAFSCSGCGLLLEADRDTGELIERTD